MSALVLSPALSAPQLRALLLLEPPMLFARWPAVALAVLCLPRVAAAQEPEPAATTRVIFERARELMAAGNYAEACPLLERALADSPGANGVKFNLGLCYEHIGRVASAWGIYLDVANLEKLANHVDREQAARQSAAAIESRVPWLTITVVRPLDGMVITRGGVKLDRVLWGSRLPVDPGDYAIAATAPERVAWTGTIHVRESENQVVSVPPLAPLAPLPAVATSLHPRRQIAIAVGGAGVVAIGIGTYYGLRAVSLSSDASGRCDDSGCDPQGFASRRDSLKAGNASTFAFTAGGVLAASAVVLWLSAPSRTAPVRQLAFAPTLGAGGALVLRGEWP